MWANRKTTTVFSVPYFADLATAALLKNPY